MLWSFRKMLPLTSSLTELSGNQFSSSAAPVVDHDTALSLMSYFKETVKNNIVRDVFVGVF